MMRLVRAMTPTMPTIATTVGLKARSSLVASLVAILVSSLVAILVAMLVATLVAIMGLVEATKVFVFIYGYLKWGKTLSMSIKAYFVGLSFVKSITSRPPSYLFP